MHYRHHYLNYGQTERAALLWAVAVGTLLGVWPHQYLLLRYGARYVLFVAGLISALATAAIPLLAFLGLPWLIVARTAQGIAYGADFSAVGIITVRWASLKQNGLFIAMLTSFNNIASIVTNPLAGKLFQTKYGWPSVFYVHSFIGFIIMLAWLICYEDDPKQHPQKIIKNSVILTVWLNAFLEIVSSQLLQTYGPTYVEKDTGYLMAVSVFMMLPVRYAAGYLSDKIKFISEIHKLRVFNTISVGGCALFHALLGFVPRHTPYLAVAVISLINILIGINVGGFYKCATLVARVKLNGAQLMNAEQITSQNEMSFEQRTRNAVQTMAQANVR
ncbi:unnamed protein product [Toxocara canis]|uniref:MFS domain-containing protein n=1 Tax=Toxocara canis TaxID=6265 RepID=A0A183V5H5_TOXCA|nr:unnamed protein product [Toxocara canis]